MVLWGLLIAYFGCICWEKIQEKRSPIGSINMLKDFDGPDLPTNIEERTAAPTAAQTFSEECRILPETLDRSDGMLISFMLI